METINKVEMNNEIELTELEELRIDEKNFDYYASEHDGPDFSHITFDLSGYEIKRLVIDTDNCEGANMAIRIGGLGKLLIEIEIETLELNILSKEYNGFSMTTTGDCETEFSDFKV